jgi:hypothetical protein
VRRKGAEVQAKLKRCIRCNEVKSETAFSRNRRSQDGRFHYCKICHSAYEKQRRAIRVSNDPTVKRRAVEASTRWRNAHRDQVRKARAARVRRRREALETLLGSRCARCGTSQGPFDFDHIDPFSKSFSIGEGRNTYPMERLIEEARKCQLLCKPCHKDKTAADRRTIREVAREVMSMRATS